MVLSDLDDDVVVALLIACDVASIVAFRLTCRRIYRLTLQHGVWSSALRQFCHLHPHLTPNWERPLCFYTASELEEMIAKLFRLEKNWAGDIPTPTSIRKFEPEIANGGSAAFSIFPGGRWLLGLESNPLRLTSYDMDSPEYPVSVLIDSNLDHDGRLMLFADSPVCKSSGPTTFGVVISSVPAEPLQGPGFEARARYSFWHIAVEGSAQPDLKLKASFAWTVDPPPSRLFLINDTDGETLIQRADQRVDLLRWCGGSFSEAACLTLPPIPDENLVDMRLFPQSRLCALYRDAVALYSRPQFTPIDPANTSHQVPSSPDYCLLQLIIFPPGRGAICLPPCPFGNTVHIWMYPDLHIFHPDSENHDDRHIPYRLKDLDTSLPSIVIGSCRSFGVHRNAAGGPRACALTHRPRKEGNDGGERYLERRITIGPEWEHAASKGVHRFDEQSGRVVCVVAKHGGRSDIHIIDFA